jgi:ABC-type nitrate/sulfonate/bicarbonate transport system permease component
MAWRALKFVARGYPIVLLLLAWQALSTSGFVPHRLLPDLGLIYHALVEGIRNGDFWYHSAFTLQRCLSAFAMAVPLGVVFGTVLARSRVCEALFEPMFTFGYAIPKIALYPIFVFIFGIESMSKIALATLEALYPITLSTYFGVRSTDRNLIWVAQNLGASRLRMFFKVYVPYALPYIFSSMRIGMHFALVVIILLELIGDNTGLGYYVTYAAASFKYASFFAGIAVIMFWGYLLDQLTVLARDLVLTWERR